MSVVKKLLFRLGQIRREVRTVKGLEGSSKKTERIVVCVLKYGTFF